MLARLICNRFMIVWQYALFFTDIEFVSSLYKAFSTGVNSNRVVASDM